MLESNRLGELSDEKFVVWWIKKSSQRHRDKGERKKATHLGRYRSG